MRYARTCETGLLDSSLNVRVFANWKRANSHALKSCDVIEKVLPEEVDRYGTAHHLIGQR